MKRELNSWFSPALQKEMPIVSYGDYGFSLLLVPTAAADYLEYERFQLMDILAPYINSGKVRVFSINSINNESWLNNDMLGEHKAIRHNQFNEYVYNEVVPFIRNATSFETPIITSGASFGALHSMNLFLKRPDLINGVISMSGVYDLTDYTKGYFDEQVYFNSPMHHLPNLTDHHMLEQIRKSQHIHILTGSGDYEDPNASRAFAGALYNKGVNYELDVWSEEWKHDWPTWRAMLPHYLETRF
ncbi:MAG: prolyl oligopeptidase family serine peptidase [Chitinophagaceae bacterium]|nr:prolyl oligopeptidase family serine peptidase [Chitinophagaceae bacterium]MBL0055047.1 prolyl oligopeptidase family serine peptidase [Chitinophagaceae bacterium]